MQTLSEAAQVVGVNIKTLSKQLDSAEREAEIRGNIIKRIAVFNKISRTG